MNVDWELLRDQKMALLLHVGQGKPLETETIDGIITSSMPSKIGVLIKVTRQRKKCSATNQSNQPPPPYRREHRGMMPTHSPQPPKLMPGKD